MNNSRPSRFALSRRDRRVLIVATVAGALVLALIGAYLAVGKSASTRDKPFTWDGADLSVDSGGQGASEPIGFDPVAPPVPDPCATLLDGQGSLLVSPDPVALKSNELDGDVFVRNCGDAAVDWQAATKPTVSLGSASGTLAPGELHKVTVAIAKSGWDPGAIEFKIKFSEPGYSHYVDVHAFRSADYPQLSTPNLASRRNAI